MKTSDTIKEISAALAAVGKEVGPAAKDGTNPHFQSAYSTLGEIIATVRPPLANHGISIVQSPSMEGATVTVETTLLHTSGEWIANECTTKAKDASPQSIGGAITYMRRYGLQSIACLASEDDDGEAAMGRGKQQNSHPEKQYATQQQIQMITDLDGKIHPGALKSEMVHRLEDFGKNFGLGNPNDWSIDESAMIINKLSAYIDGKEQ